LYSIGIRRKKRRCDSAQMETRTRRYRIVALRQAISSPNVSVNTRLQGKLSTMPHPVRRRLLAVTIAFAASGSALAAPPVLNDLEYFSKPGLDVLAFNHHYDGPLSDATRPGVASRHPRVRTATQRRRQGLVQAPSPPLPPRAP